MVSRQQPLRSRLVTALGVVLSAAAALVAMHLGHRTGDPVNAFDPPGEEAPADPPAVDPTTVAEAFAVEATPLVRTDFGDDAAWSRVVDLVQRPVDFDDPGNPDPGPDAYAPYVVPIDAPAHEGVTGGELAERAMAAGEMEGYVLLADARSMAEAAAGGEVTVDYVDLSPYAAQDAEEFSTFPGRSFRCVVTEVASIEVNLSIDNVDFHEFADAVGPDGVFRGFTD